MESSQTEEVFIKNEPSVVTEEQCEILLSNHNQEAYSLYQNELTTILHENENDRKRRSITLQEKIDIIKRYEKNERTRDIMRDTGINESTLRSIRNNAEKIKSSVMSGTNVSKSAAKTSRTRPKLLEETERLLGIWVEEQLSKPCLTHKKIPFKITLTEKALLIYNELKKKVKRPNDVIPFTASNSWYKGFKKRYNLSNYRMLGDAFGTSVFHKQRTMTAPTITKLTQTLTLPDGLELGELGKPPPSRGMIIEPVFNKNLNNGTNVTTQNSDSDTSTTEISENISNNDSVIPNNMKIRRNELTLQEKIYMNELFEKFEERTESKEFRKSSTLKSNQDETDKKKCEEAVNADKLVEQMEEILKLWIEQEIDMETDVSLSMVRRKAVEYYQELVNMCENKNNIKPFIANNAWLYDYKNYYNLHEVRDDLYFEYMNVERITRHMLSEDESSSSDEETFINFYPETVLEEKETSASSNNQNSSQRLVEFHTLNPQIYKNLNLIEHPKNEKIENETSIKSIPSNIKLNSKPKVLNYGMNVTALMNIKDNIDKNKKTLIQPITSKPNIIVEIERLLCAWMDTEKQKSTAISLTAIQEKAIVIYEDLKKTYNPNEVARFNASFSWLINFKNRHKLNIKIENKVPVKSSVEISDKNVRNNNLTESSVSSALRKIEAGLNVLEASDSHVKRRDNVIQGIKRLLSPYYEFLEESNSKRQKLQE